MYTEIIKIIEGGLIGDREKVFNYSKVLANNIAHEGNNSLAKKILSVMNNKKGRLASLDSFSTKPVDSESRMDIVEISYPSEFQDEIIFDESSQCEVETFIDCYKNRDEILKAGLDPLNSLLLYGPPGCGKTTTAQYIAYKTDLPLVTARLDGLISSLLGSSAKNLRKIFEYSSQRECILFLDEFDVIAKLRDDKTELGELKRVVNSLIQNIDNFSNNSLLLAATNHHKLLDPAIWRRFSKIITLNLPREEEILRLIKSLFQKHISITAAFSEKKLTFLANALLGLSHSDIQTIISNSIRQSVLKKSKISYCDILHELYLHKNHSISSEDEYIRYLLSCNATQREINEFCSVPLRKVQNVSKQINLNKGGDIHE